LCFLTYEKHFYRNGKKILEYYIDHKLTCFFETVTTSDYKITEGFSSEGEMFTREKIEYNSQGKPITEERLIYNADGTTTNEKFDLA